jgi:methylated-DNA-[protein]-cysteine S-methyltransferase
VLGGERARQRLSGSEETQVGVVTAMNSINRSNRIGLNSVPDDALVDGLIRAAHAGLERKVALFRRPEAAVGMVRSALGPLLIAEGPRGLAMIHYVDSGGTDRAIALLRSKFDPVEDAGAVEPVAREIGRLLEGHVDALKRRVDLSLVESRFRLEALKRLCDVPPGAVVTYQALAAQTGSPSAQRAVGSAMATNPIPVYVPCHRVVRSDGSVGWYGGGPANKIRLLRAEGFEVDRRSRCLCNAICGHRETRIYCRPECDGARRANRSDVVIFASPQSARQAGMRPCKDCCPTEELSD